MIIIIIILVIILVIVMILVNLSVVFLLLLDSAMSEAERLEFAWRDVTAAAGSRPCLYEHLQLAENMGGALTV